jgi:hypothetical protein
MLWVKSANRGLLKDISTFENRARDMVYYKSATGSGEKEPLKPRQESEKSASKKINKRC